ncbi:MAG TPA: hypothetical protein VED17_02865 [Nitrososphaerales archaeon]|nr:hypothetical protein [Nitrososphaerales archaeon]
MRKWKLIVIPVLTFTITLSVAYLKNYRSYRSATYAPVYRN